MPRSLGIASLRVQRLVSVVDIVAADGIRGRVDLVSGIWIYQTAVIVEIYRCDVEWLTVRKRGGRKRALGTRAPMSIPQDANLRWSLDLVMDMRFSPGLAKPTFRPPCFWITGQTSPPIRFARNGFVRCSRRPWCFGENTTLPLRPAGAAAYADDVPRAEVHLLDAGHFALDEATDDVACPQLS